MKSHSTYIDKNNNERGFILLDVVIALSVAAIILSSLFIAVFQNDRFNDSIKARTKILSNDPTLGTSYKTENYDLLINTFPSDDPRYKAITFSNYSSRNTDARDSRSGLCSPDNVFDSVESISEISLGGINDEVTHVSMKGRYVIASRDDSLASASDLDFFSINPSGNLSLVSSLDTGPGIVGFDYGQSHLYALRAGTAYQLQVIDISDPAHLSMPVQFRVLLPYATATPPLSRTISLSGKYLYIGTQKWDGPELIVVDIHDPLNPAQVGSYEVGSIVNSILIKGTRAFVAAGGQFQFMEFNVSNPASPALVGSLEFPGWQTQEGKSLALDGDNLIFGRSVGGFNNIHNHELFVIDTDTLWSSATTPIVASFDVGRSIYGIAVGSGTIMTIESGVGQRPYRYSIENLEDGPIAVTNTTGTTTLSGTLTSIWCDDVSAYVSTKSPPKIYKFNFNMK